MSTWEPQSLAEVVQQISDNKYVLPVIQRNLVWNENKMELLFDSLLKKNAFGGIMVLEEERGEAPLFAFRKFSRDGETHPSLPVDKLEHITCLVIDGQQRLQSFYMGLVGSINQKSLYFNLLSTSLEYEFEFANTLSDLPLTETDDADHSVNKFWYPVNTLFNRLKKVRDSRQVANEIKALNKVNGEEQRDQIEDNVYQFFLSVFVFKTIGLSLVTVNKTRREDEKQRIVELFRRLNDGGTRLSSFDLVASVFKGFDYRMEQFFKSSQQFESLGVAQDEVIKLLFLLEDFPSKEVTQIKQEDADFAITNRDRIMATLRGVVQFLKYADLYDYYLGSNRSVIPLYFIAYHIFHKADIADANLDKVYDNYDTNNPDFICLKRWVYLSVLNSVFSRGSGWIPYKTGIRKILQVLKAHKGQRFPVDALFDMYRNHPTKFNASIKPDKLESWEREFVFYLIYNYKSITGRDVDHIQPRSLLEAALAEETDQPKYQQSQIHSTANYQLLDIGTNRGAKQGKELKAWLENNVTVLDFYLQQHLIPTDPQLWEINNFNEFWRERARLIANHVQECVPEAITPLLSVPTPPPVPVDQPDDPPPVKVNVDKEALRQQLSSEYHDHLILDDNSTWPAIYKQSECGPIWANRYNKELELANIETVADFALFIMVCNLEFVNKATYGDIHRFHHPTPDGQIPTLRTKEFGGWGWQVALKELERRDFNWQEFLVNDPSSAWIDIDKEALRQQLPPEYRNHPILDDNTTWHPIYEQAGHSPQWAGRYSNVLRSANMETLSDFALFIMLCNLEITSQSSYGTMYRFHHSTPQGYIPNLKTSSFATWGWNEVLNALKERGFNWQEFLVNDK